MYKTFYRATYRLIRSFLLRARLFGLVNAPKGGPAILVCNHEGAYGPVAMVATLRAGFRPWVIWNVMQNDSAADYIHHDFVEKELHLKGPVARILARIIGRICVAPMRGIGAIPVYKGSHFIQRTIESSLAALAEGQMLLVFPEIPESENGHRLGVFDTGFLGLARLYHERTGRTLDIRPIAVSRVARSIVFGDRVVYGSEDLRPGRREKVLAAVETSIARMLASVESPGKL